MFKFLNILAKKDIKSAAVGSVLIKFGSAFFAFLNGVLLAQYLSVEGFGLYILAFSSMTVLSIPTSMGLHNLITRYISKYEVYNDLSSMKGLLIKTNQFVLFSIIIIYTIAVITYFFWWKRYDTDLVETLLYSFILLPLLGFGALSSAALRGLKLVILSELLDTLIRNFLLTLCILFCIVVEFQLTPKVIIIFQIIAATTVLFLGLIFLQIKLFIRLNNIKATYANKEWYTQTIPFAINSGIQVLKSKLLTYILVIFGSMEAVAIFEVAMRGAALVSYSLDALNKAISPFISSAYEKSDFIYLQRIIKKTSRIIFIFSLPIALVFIIGGSSLIELIFGKNYESSYIPLVILCIGQLISVMTGSVGLVLNMTGNQSVYSKSNITMLIINILLSIPLVIYYNVIGASLIFSGVLILQKFILLAYVRRELHINTSIF